MSTDRQGRTYRLHELDLRVHSSAAMAACLDGRFRMFPLHRECLHVACFDFQAVRNPSQHAVNRPQGEGKPFYEMPNGEACYFRETDEVYLRFGDGVRALCQPGPGRAVISTLESDPRSLFVASHLVLTILLIEISRRRGWYSLHAAGFSQDGKAILIPGISGVGKSTLSVALLRAKFDYLSDDMVFLKRRPDHLAVRGFPEDVDVSDQTIRFFPELAFLLRSPKTDGFTKRQLRIKQVYGTKPVLEALPSVIIFPRISRKHESVLAEIDADAAFHEIVPNVLLTEGRTCQQHLGVLAELVKGAHCYWLDTGQDFDRIPVLLRRLLSRDRELVRG